MLNRPPVHPVGWTSEDRTPRTRANPARQVSRFLALQSGVEQAGAGREAARGRSGYRPSGSRG